MKTSWKQRAVATLKAAFLLAVPVVALAFFVPGLSQFVGTQTGAWGKLTYSWVDNPLPEKPAFARKTKDTGQEDVGALLNNWDYTAGISGGNKPGKPTKSPKKPK